MLDINDAIAVCDHKSGRQKRLSYIFACKYDGCRASIRIEKSAFKRCTGFCRQHAKSNKLKPFGQAFNAIKNNALRKQLEFSLTYNEFEFLAQLSHCNYCGSIINRKQFNHTAYYLDRKDNNKGYVFDNLVVCCTACNLMKRDWLSYEEFKRLTAFSVPR